MFRAFQGRVLPAVEQPDDAQILQKMADEHAKGRKIQIADPQVGVEKQQAGYKKGKLGGPHRLRAAPKSVQVEDQPEDSNSQKAGFHGPHREMDPEQVLINRREAVNMQECQAPVHAEKGSTCKAALGERTRMEAPIDGKDAGALHGHMKDIPHIEPRLHGGVHLRESQRHHPDEDQDRTDKKSQAPRTVVRQVLITQVKAEARDIVWNGNQIGGGNEDAHAPGPREHRHYHE